MLEPGSTFDRYRIEAFLGRGGMGAVYRAWDDRLGRRVALKLVGSGSDETLQDEDRSAMVVEAQLAARLRHPNVVTVYDVGDHQGSVFLTMELVPGMSLRTRLRRGPVAPGDALAWLSAIAAALKAAHLAGVLHRDVKPENVMLCDDGTVKLLDFGIAKRDATAGMQTMTGRIVGTPRYMAPEQIMGMPLDAACDQFAWGVVAYELLAGKQPWHLAQVPAHGAKAASPFDRGHAIPLGEVAPHLPAAAAAVVMRTLAESPRARFATVEQAARALVRAYPGAPMGAPLTSPPPAPSDSVKTSAPTTADASGATKATRRSRGPLLLAIVPAAVLAVGALAVFGILWLSRVTSTGGGGAAAGSGPALSADGDPAAIPAAIPAPVESAPAASTAPVTTAPGRRPPGTSPVTSPIVRPATQGATAIPTTAAPASAAPASPAASEAPKPPPPRRIRFEVRNSAYTEPVLLSALEPRRAAIEQCFDARDLVGYASAELHVEADGTIKEMHQSGSPLVQLCLHSALQTLRFPPLGGREHTVVGVTFHDDAKTMSLRR